MNAILLCLPLLCAPALSQETSAPELATPQQRLQDCFVGKPTELFEVTRVVDGDTIWIEREGKREKLRLLSVDTEEKFQPGNNSTSKPGTPYGERCAGWAQGFFGRRHPAEGPSRVGLRFPGKVEARDIYGRLLCHVVTDQGIDFNLLLVRNGMSPYFNKYGNSLLEHDAFAQAQERAQAERLGVWDTRTNQGAPSRPYDRLLPWWSARAEAMQTFRGLVAASPKTHVFADDPMALAAALAAASKEPITACGLVDRLFDEDDGSLTILLRGGDKRNSLRVKIPAEDRAAMAAVDLERAQAEYAQNYLLFVGTLQRGKRGFDLVGVQPREILRAGPEPR